MPFGATGSLIVLSTSAAGQTALQSLQNGATTDQAFELATVAGAVELLTEKIPVDNLFTLMKGGKNTLKQGLKATAKRVFVDGGKEAGMEAAQEVIGQYINTVADEAIMGDKSQYNRLVEQYVSDGKSRGQAERDAFNKLYIQDTLVAGLQGGLSGFAMGSGGSFVGGLTAPRANTGMTTPVVASESPVIMPYAQAEKTTQNASIPLNPHPASVESIRQAYEKLIAEQQAANAENVAAENRVRDLTDVYREKVQPEGAGADTVSAQQVENSAGQGYNGINTLEKLYDEAVHSKGTEGAGDDLSGPVEITPPSNATPQQIAQTKAYIDGSNQALEAGKLSPSGRVSTAGSLRIRANASAASERARAAAAGTPYQGHVGHVPDTTWTGTADPFSWLDLDPSVNMSIGGQANRYPIGYKPTEFRFRNR
ncbi:hypothetical protein AAFA46_00865 [Oscillospiraceae bacterium WX1]